MKKYYALLVLMALAVAGFGQTSDLIISEYIEGSGNNKAIEIYNGTGADVDLSGYQVWKVTNGGSWPESTLSLSGTLTNGDVYVIYNSSADPAIVAVGDITWGSATWNGDDAVGLAKDDGSGTFALIDAVGEDGADPGTAWDVAGVTNATKDHTLVRKETICSPNTNWTTSAGTNATDSEWIVYSKDDFSHLGSHTSTCGGSSGPDNPTSLLATTISTSEIDLSWTRNSNLDAVMLVWSPDNSFGTPADGTAYAVGDTIPGGDSVLYVGTDTTYAHTALTQGTQYYYKAFSVDGSTAYSAGVTDDAITFKEEPSNHVASFAAGTPTASAIPLTWLDNDGAVAADNYLVMINLTGTFTAPVDGTPQADDTDVSDGSGVVNVAHGDQAYTWTGLTQGTHYYFTIYPYTNTGSAINYKTDGTIPADDTTTLTITANTDLIISEVADPADVYQGRYVELYNLSPDTIFFTSDTWYLVKQSNGGSYSDIQLTDTIPPGEAYTVAYSQSDFNTAYGVDPNQISGSISGNGDDGYFLYYGGNETTGTLIDAYGVIDEDGTGKPWEYQDGKAVRKRSVGSPNSTWTSSEWVITRPANVVNMTPGQHFNYVSWQGTTDSNWDTKANWDNGFIPDVSMDVTIGTSSNNPVIGTTTVARCWDITVDAAATLTIQSDASGRGALIANGTATGDATVQCYVTSGKWHGIAASVSGQTANNLYFSGNPDVWAKYYNESDNTYDYITTLSTALGDMKGWMVWVDSTGGVTDATFNFDGALRSGTVSPSESIVRSQAGDGYGYNFVGNPFTATIDWDATTGWTKTNLNDAVYVYNDTSFASYVGGTSTNGGSNLIAMNQGFFVQVADDGSTSATLQATADVCTGSTSTFRKAGRADNDYSLVRLTVTANDVTDETVVKLKEGATEGFDGNYDAHKFFSFNSNYPQIFSTANGKMSINTLPLETGYVNMDVTGKNGDLMTIAITERTNLNEVWLVDELTGIQTDLVKEPYTFIYDNTFAYRFTLHFSIVGVNEQAAAGNGFKIYSSGHEANVVIPANTRANIEIYNLLGQKVTQAANRSGLNRFAMPGNQYYVVKVYNGTTVETRKILIQ